MAKIFPDTLPESVLSDPYRSSERKVFDALSSLPRGYTVFYSVAWQARIKGNTSDGEADFVVAHPDHGILVIEVKGGNIGYDAATGQWTTTDRHKDVHKIDPVEQARKNHYTLLEKLSDLPGWDQGRFLNMGHALCFPDVIVDERSLRLDLPRSIIIDHDDLSKITETIISVFDHYGAQGPSNRGALGQDRLAMVEALLARSFKITTPLGVELALEDERLVELTAQQYRLLDFLGTRRQALIAGCAGSGKTMLAVEKARKLTEQGFNVLLTCFNAALAGELAERLPDTTVFHFHGLCKEIVSRVGYTLRPYANEQEYHDVILPNALMDAIDQTDLRFDAIIVDEGQDFKETYWLALSGLLKEKDSILYIFYDDNQNLYGGTLSFSGILNEAPFPLTDNCRNTQAIHKVVANFHYKPDALVCRGPAGCSPEFIAYDDKNQMLLVLQKMLHRLIQEEHIDSRDIVVLTPFGQERTGLKPGLRLGNFIITQGTPSGQNEIQATSIYRFKGLERRVVIIAEIDSEFAYNKEMVMYVGCSRARTHLIFLVEKGTPADLKEQVEKFCKPGKS